MCLENLRFSCEAYIAFCLFAVLNVMTGTHLQEGFIDGFLLLVKIWGILHASLATMMNSGELDTLRALSLDLRFASRSNAPIFDFGASVTTVRRNMSFLRFLV